jgi:putative PIG3 family NAD(P)H quinone oxidoreductase
VRAISVEGQGTEAKLAISDVPEPVLGEGQIRIRVRATAINRADLLQRRGLYPPPPGAPATLGLECAGTVLEAAPDVSRFRSGDRVMALLPGGGYAEQVTVDAGSAMAIPERLSFDAAAGVPEVFLTCFLNLFQIARAPAGGTALVHGGGSGIGTAAIQLLVDQGVRTLVTAGSPEKLSRCRELGAALALNYRDGEFAPAVLDFTGGAGVDVVLDSIGAPYLAQHLRCLATGGRLVLIGLLGGARAELDLGLLLQKRLHVIGSTLRARPLAEKAEIVRGFEQRFGAALREGRIAPVIDRVLPLERAQEAHHVLERSEHFGKVVLRID